MNTTAVSMPSVTLAIKAKRMFNEQGFTCRSKEPQTFQKTVALI